MCLWRALCTSFIMLYCVRSSVRSQPTSSTPFSEQNLFKTNLAAALTAPVALSSGGKREGDMLLYH